MAHQNPWKTKSSKRIYDNPWIRLDEDQVVNPAGGDGIYGKVHFKNRAVAIIPVDQGYNTWLVGQTRYVFGAYSWEVPMGGAPIDESPLECAKKELKEETGLSAKCWQSLLHLDISNSITDETGDIYLATDLTCGETDFEDTEDITVKKLPLSEALAMALNGEISDALSVAGLMRLALMYPAWFEGKQD